METSTDPVPGTSSAKDVFDLASSETQKAIESKKKRPALVSSLYDLRKKKKKQLPEGGGDVTKASRFDDDFGGEDDTDVVPETQDEVRH